MTDDDNKTAKKKVEQNDPNGKVLKSHRPDLLCTDQHLISIYRPCVIIDSHMHLQSGNCAPLPFLWKRLSVLAVAKPGRGFIDGAGEGIGFVVDLFTFKHVVGASRYLAGCDPDENDGYYLKNGLRMMVPEAKNSTFEIGKGFIKKKRQQVYDFFKSEEQYKDLSHLLFSSVVMTMDMEYAHVDGYFGIKTYNPIYADTDFSKDPIHYWYPRHGFWQWRGNSYVRVDKKQERSLLPEKGQTQEDFDRYKKSLKTQGITGAYHDNKTHDKKQISIEAAACLTSDKETARYERWTKQLQYTELIALANPLKLLPMFHYDPRRWELKGNQEVFDKVRKGIHLGFKMYTAQGYRPWDIRRLPALKDFYTECCKSQTPIMNHCTPDGAFTFDREEYFDFVHPNDTDEDQRAKDANGRKQQVHVGFNPAAENENPYFKKLEYFNEQFVSPDAWRQVLDGTGNDGRALNDLRLCLAHFGGDSGLGREWGRADH